MPATKKLASPVNIQLGVCGVEYSSCMRHSAGQKIAGTQAGKSSRAQRQHAPTCGGCRVSGCQQCELAICAAAKKVVFCVQCAAFPCQPLLDFQQTMPHRQDLWRDLARIKEAGAAELYVQQLYQQPEIIAAGAAPTAAASCHACQAHGACLASKPGKPQKTTRSSPS